MAKEDFCFTYYDGDAARDKAHMTRLERGAYDDIISAQRKKGHLSIEDIKRVLSKDFDHCWPSLEWILLKDSEGKFFIEWVDISVLKSKANSQKNKDRINEYWRKVEAGEIIPKNRNGNTKTIPRNKNGIHPVIPLGYEDGNENGDGKVNNEEGLGEGNFVVPQMLQDFKSKNPKYLVDQNADFLALHDVCKKIMEWDNLTGWVSDNHDHIMKRWGELSTHIKADGHLSKYSLSQISKHFQSIIQSFNNHGTNRTSKQNHSHQPIITGRATGAGAFPEN